MTKVAVLLEVTTYTSVVLLSISSLGKALTRVPASVAMNIDLPDCCFEVNSVLENLKTYCGLINT